MNDTLPAMTTPRRPVPLLPVPAPAELTVDALLVQLTRLKEKGHGQRPVCIPLSGPDLNGTPTASTVGVLRAESGFDWSREKVLLCPTQPVSHDVILLRKELGRLCKEVDEMYDLARRLLVGSSTAPLFPGDEQIRMFLDFLEQRHVLLVRRRADVEAVLDSLADDGVPVQGALFTETAA